MGRAWVTLSNRQRGAVALIVWAVAFEVLAVAAAIPGGPRAALVADDLSPIVGQTVHFDASASEAHDQGLGRIVAYRFDFGDGAFANGTAAVVTHAYALPGTYLVTLNVTDDDGSTDSQLRGVLVRLPNAPPLAVATVDSPNGNLSTSFLFDGQNSTDDRGIAGY